MIKRDGGCYLANSDRVKVAHFLSPCSGYRKDGELILQCDHLVTRSNSATFADTRLMVCLCKGHHGWKSVGSNLRKAQYDALMREILPKDRVELWDKCEKESWKPHKMNWKVELTALKQEYKSMS